MTISGAEVENWLDANPEWAHEYFLRKADMSFINKWLIMHNFHTLQDYVTGRRGSLSQDSSGQTSPDPRHCFSPDNTTFFIDGKHQRSNSKKYLRQDYAKARKKSMFRTHEPSFSSDHASTLAERRSSLKGMRQFLSLPPTSGSLLSLLIQSKVRLPRYASKDEELKRELRHINDRDFFLEIVRDISHELDLKALTSRILVNLCILLDADRSSLFFVEGPKGKQTLVSKVFDMYTGTDTFPTTRGDNIIRVPWGRGIIGYVAETGQTVNITNVAEDPRYKDDADRIVNYSTESLLCMPIRNSEGEVIGVVQVINKNNVEGVFSNDDEKMLETYIAFCGMAITNAQGMESYTREYDRNKALLEVVHDLFGEQTSVDAIVTKIMQRAQTLLQCERCVVMLKDPKEFQSEKSSFGRVFDLQQPCRNGQSKFGPCSSPGMIRAGKIAEAVASTGETVNLTAPFNDARFNVDCVENVSGFQARSILCKPIRNKDFQTIGVAQLINKVSGETFDEHDDQLFEAFCIFCGIGINNCLLYDEVARSAARQAVALEVLSYHAAVPSSDVVRFKCKTIPETRSLGLQHLDFNDFSLNADEMILAGMRMFMDSGLLNSFKIEYETLIRWLLTVRKNYRPIAYHNWRHAFNVCQCMFALLTTGELKKYLSDLECLALLVACLCHDLDHRGTNNTFLHKSSSPLAQLYGTSATLEHHHFNHAVIILQSEGHNIFGNLSASDYSSVMNFLKQAILATDLSLHIQVRRQFFPLVESGLCSWDDREQRDILRSILMTSCDIATITKPWDIQRKAADLVVTEFFNQGDQERTVLKIQPQALMDRERQDELPRLQMEWIDGICYPLYKHFAMIDRKFQGMFERVLRNREHWEILDGQRLARDCETSVHGQNAQLPRFRETDV